MKRIGTVCGVGLLVLSCSLFTGCVTEPITGRQRLILTPQGFENNLGVQAWGETQQKETLSSNAAHVAAVLRTGRTIAAAVNEPGYDWEFKCFQDETANAFCLPGGKVAVYEGLFEFLSNDAELAAVMGHEIAHATARHGGERMTQAMAAGVGAVALAVALNDKPSVDKERWLLAYTGVSTLGVLAYSRKHEYAADKIGLYYMARAGYNPQGAVDFWVKFAEKGSQMPAIAEFLSTHPLGEKRIERLKAELPGAMAEYAKATQKHGFGESYR